MEGAEIDCERLKAPESEEKAMEKEIQKAEDKDNKERDKHEDQDRKEKNQDHESEKMDEHKKAEAAAEPNKEKDKARESKEEKGEKECDRHEEEEDESEQKKTKKPRKALTMEKSKNNLKPDEKPPQGSARTKVAVSESDVAGFLFRELAVRRWIEDVVGEDLEDKPGGPGEGGLQVALHDGVRLCKLMLYLVPRSVPKIFETTKSDSEFAMRKNIGFFIEALGEAELSSAYIFTVSDLYDQDNFLKVLECLEALGKKADEEWKVEISLKTKEALLKRFKNEIRFTPAQEERARKLLEKCLPKRRGNSRGTTPTTTPRSASVGGGEDGKKGIANTKIRKKVKKPDGRTEEPEPDGSEATPVVTAEEEPNEDMLRIMKALYEGRKDTGFGTLDRSVSGHFGGTVEVIVFLKGLMRLQACCRAVPARRLLRVKQRNAAYRENVAREIHKTEADYISSLNVLIEKIMRPLKDKMEKRDKDGMMNFKSLFSDIQIIRGYQTNLMEELEPRIKNWTANQRLGDVFVQISQFLKVYTSYVSRYNSAIQELSTYKKLDPKIAELILELQKDPDMNNQEVNSFLIRPIQRIPRYLLLLKDLFKHTEKTHNDYDDLEKAYKQIEEVASFVEAESEKAERIGKLFEIQSRLYGDFQSLATPSRRFIKEAQVTMWSADNQEIRRRVIFLFNDLIVEAKAVKKAGLDILEYRECYHLTRMAPALLPEDLAGKLQHPSRSHANMALVESTAGYGIALNDGNVTLVKLFAASESEREVWFEALTAVHHEIEEKRMQHEALVLERAKKKAQEAQAGLMERYKSSGHHQVYRRDKLFGSGEGTEEDSTKSVQSRWESRLRELKEKRDEAAKEQKPARWEKRLQAHTEYLAYSQEDMEAPRKQGSPHSSTEELPAAGTGKNRAKKARKRAQSDGKSATLSGGELVKKRERAIKRLSLRRRRPVVPDMDEEPPTAIPLVVSSSPSVRSARLDENEDEDNHEDNHEDHQIDRETKKTRRRSFGALSKGSSFLGMKKDSEEAKEARRRSFRTASAFALLKRKKRVEVDGQPEKSKGKKKDKEGKEQTYGQAVGTETKTESRSEGRKGRSRKERKNKGGKAKGKNSEESADTVQGSGEGEQEGGHEAGKKNASKGRKGKHKRRKSRDEKTSDDTNSKDSTDDSHDGERDASRKYSQDNKELKRKNKKKHHKKDNSEETTRGKGEE